MSEEEVTLKIANVTVQVPVCKDLATTKAIAAAIEQRMREVEAGSKRIDSTAFALRVAFEFASDLHLLREEQEGTVQEIAVALDGMLQRMEAVAGKMEEGS